MHRRAAIRSLGLRVGGLLGIQSVHAFGPKSDESGKPPNGHGPAAGPLEVSQTPEGPFLIDRFGRAVVLHGVDIGQRTAPFIRPDDEFDETDVARIRSWGLNAVWLGIIWEGVMPKRGVVNTAYIDRIVELTELFDRYNIYFFIDMHQDLYSREFHGDGAPSWAVYTDGVPY